MTALLTRQQLADARELSRTEAGAAHVALTLETFQAMWGMLNSILSLRTARPDDIEEKRRIELNMRALAGILAEAQA